MSRLPVETQGYRARSAAEEGRGQRPPAPHRASGGIPTGWLIAGAVVVGLGALAWYTLGPDLRRYLKIRNM